MNSTVLNFCPTASTDISALKKVWENLNPNSCPYHYNFHMHTVCSDGQLTPEKLIMEAINIGLKGLAITDHHNARGFQRAQDYLKQKQDEQSPSLLPHLWSGIEVTSDLNGTEVHLLGYGFDPHHPQLESYLSGDRPWGKDAQAKTVINRLQEAGGLVVLAHPLRYRRSPTELIEAGLELGLDGVEAYYAYNNPKPWYPSPRETEEVCQLADKHNLYTTCGTDSHGSSILVRV
jgi:predicted metal-dependent phosphoesterase TrpH